MLPNCILELVLWLGCTSAARNATSAGPAALSAPSRPSSTVWYPPGYNGLCRFNRTVDVPSFDFD